MNPKMWRKWKTWVDPEFAPSKIRRMLVLICGHDVLSDNEFMAINPGTNKGIKGRIRNNLEELRSTI